jgi:hypothetical protein
MLGHFFSHQISRKDVDGGTVRKGSAPRRAFLFPAAKNHIDRLRATFAQADRYALTLMSLGPLTTRDKRKHRREFRRKGYRAVYLEVSGYPPSKRELAHEWLREKERASDRRARWIFAAIVVSAVAAAAVAVPSENLIRRIRSRKENRIMIETDGDLLQISAWIYTGLLSFA